MKKSVLDDIAIRQPKKVNTKNRSGVKRPIEAVEREKRRIAYNFDNYSISQLHDLSAKILSERESMTMVSLDTGENVNIISWYLINGRRAKEIGIKFEPPEKIHKIYLHVNRLIVTHKLIQHEIANRELEEDDEVLTSFKDKIIELLAKGYSLREIHELILSNVERKNISFLSLEKFKDKHQVDITNVAKIYQDTFDDLPYAKKRRRIEELHEVLYIRRKELNNNKSIANSKELRDTLAQIKDECEGLTLRIDMDLKHAIEVHVMQDEIQGINPLQIVLANVAGKQGLNPLWFQARLAQSYYAKINGFVNANIKDDFFTEILYPSEVLYDFDKLESKAKEVQEKDRQEMFLKIEEPKQNEKQIEEANRIKEAFLSKMRKK